MTTILIFIALTGVFAAPTCGYSLESLKTLVMESMTTINDYRDTFREGLLHEFDSLEREAMNEVYKTSYEVSNLVYEKQLEANGNGINIESCVESLGEDLNEIVSGVHPRLRTCENPAITFATKFVSFITYQGNTGDLMLEGLATTAKHLAQAPNQAEKCYKKFEWYASVISANYNRTTEVFKEGLDYLQDFLRGNVAMCFDMTVVYSQRDLQAIGEAVVSCIDQQIGQH